MFKFIKELFWGKEMPAVPTQASDRVPFKPVETPPDVPVAPVKTTEITPNVTPTTSLPPIMKAVKPKDIVNFDAMSKDQLVEFAQKKNIKIDKRARKAVMIATINASLKKNAK